jgi:hypothetical protein
MVADQREKQPHRFQPCNRGKGVVVVDSRLLDVTLGDEAGFVLDDVAGLFRFSLYTHFKSIERCLRVRSTSSQVPFSSTDCIFPFITARHAASLSASRNINGSPVQARWSSSSRT